MLLSGSMSNFALHTLYSDEQRPEHKMQINSGYIEIYFLPFTEDLTFFQKTNHLNFHQWNKIRQNPLKLTGLPNALRAIPEKNICVCVWGGGGGEEGKPYIFLWVVGVDIFQIIWVIGV